MNMPKTLKEAKDMAQSWIDAYHDNCADRETVDILQYMASHHGQILDNVVHMSWFRDALANDILSHEGMRG
jgi:hypothetical protein